MSEQTILCRRCGTANPAGDQFCGSCGAFLEWEGTAAPDGAGIEPATEPDTGPIAPEPEPAIPLPINDPPPPTPYPINDPPVPAMTGFSVCPTCGSGNPPGRTFCHSCGNRLDQKPSTGASGPGATHGDEPRRGLPGWLPVVLGAGLVVGIVVVLMTVVFKPATPPSTATASATLTPTLEVPPSITMPPASLGSTGSGVAPSVAPGGAVQLSLTGATASASAPDAAADLAVDGSLETCWTVPPEGAEQWIEVTFATSRLDYLVIYSGCQASHESFVATSRPQNVTVSVNGEGLAGYILADSELPQRIDVDDTPAATVVRVQILSKFIGVDNAATSISEIRAFGAPGG